MQGEFLVSDSRVIVGNARLTGLHGLASIWLPSFGAGYSPMDQWQPLTYTLWWFERRLFGLTPVAFQFVTLGLHSICTVLLWRLLQRLGVRGALVAAALFALHPVQVESVAWIYEQKNPLSGVFFFLSLHAFLSFDASRSRGWYAAAVVAFVVALLAKSTAVVLPAVLLLYLWVRPRYSGLRDLLPTAPFFALGLGMAALTIWYEGAVTGATGVDYDTSLLERVARVGDIVVFNASKLVFPRNLAFFYPKWSVDASQLAAYGLDLLIAALMLFLLWQRRSRWGRPALLGIGWYLIHLAPVVGLVDIYYHQVSLVADHWQYLPLIGPIALLCHAGASASAAAGETERSSADTAEARPGRLAAFANAPVASAIGIALIAGAGLLSWQRAHVFANDGALSRDAYGKYPSSWVAYQKAGEYSLGLVTSGAVAPAGVLDQAIAEFERAVELMPGKAQLHDSLGVALAMKGRHRRARKNMEQAVALAPETVAFRTNLAQLYVETGEDRKAVRQLREAARLLPSSPAVLLALGKALRESGPTEAQAVLARAVELATPLSGRSPAMAELQRSAEQLRKQLAAEQAAALRALGAEAEAGVAEARSVLLLTVDTLRPDYLGFNGYPEPVSPVLDELLAQSFYFGEALTPVPRTTPALASLMTGLYPHASSVRQLVDPLPDQLVTLAEAFSAAGHATFAVVTNMMLGPERGLDAGFDHYDPAFDVRDARATTDAAIARIAGADTERPLFAWVHYIDPHVPYHPAAGTVERLAPEYRGRFAEGFGHQPRGPEALESFKEFPEGLSKADVTHRNPLTESENAHVRKLYAGDIWMTDREIGRLVSAYRARFPRGLIAFTADHGESLGEHDYFYDHGDYVYNAASRVPLAFNLPSDHAEAGRARVDGWVSLVDVAPTLVELAGIEAPPAMSALFEGRSLVPRFEGGDAAQAPVASFIESGTSFFPELVRRRQRNDVDGRFRAVVLDDWKLIWTPFLPEAEGWELFDLANDPNEATNLYRADHPRVSNLRPLLEAWMARAGPGAEPTASAEGNEADREALRALGYIE